MDPSRESTASFSESLPKGSASSLMRSCVRRPLVFVHGKGGVGKSSIARAIASGLSSEGAKTLLAEFENPTREPGELREIAPRLWHLNADAMIAFEEYAGLKIEKLGSIGGGVLGGLGALGATGITKLFTQNRLIKYLAKAAPGIHELVLLGKVWHEREKYDHVIVDMPSTGYGLAMFQSTVNFSKLFGGGPLSRDAEEMLSTFADPARTGHLIVALPEEMPLQEAIELNDHLKQFFPANPAAFVVNRSFPSDQAGAATSSPKDWTSPYASSVQDYILRRSQLEAHNLRLWEQAGLQWSELDYQLPSDPDQLASDLARQMKERDLL